jgi:hypothetical protein
MIRAIAAIALVVCVSAIGVAAGALDRGSTSTRTARLHLADAAPLKLRGTGFVAGERVRVTVTAETRRTKRVSADRSGRFVTRVAGVGYDRCNGLLAQAVGSEGSLARLKLPQPLCPPN